jgi:hypothetical protein
VVLLSDKRVSCRSVPQQDAAVWQADVNIAAAAAAAAAAVAAQVQAHLQVKKSLPPGWSAAWLQRPLDPQLLEYAVWSMLCATCCASWHCMSTSELQVGILTHSAM